MSISENMLISLWKSTGRGDVKRLSTQRPPEGVDENDNIRYRESQSQYHLMDVYRPHGAEGLLPVIFGIHGGGWMYGDKELNKNYYMELATRGFAVVNISYRLFPEVSLGQAVEDIFDALNYTIKNAETLGLDVQKMCLTGDSAGGFYAGLVLSILADDKLKELYGVDSTAVFRAVGFTCPAVSPFFEKYKIPVTQEYTRMFFDKDKKYKEHKFYESAHIVRNRLNAFPPIFLNSCEGDFIKSESFALAKALKANGIDFDFCFFKKENAENPLQHVYAVTHPLWKESVATNDRLCDFFRSKL